MPSAIQLEMDFLLAHSYPLITSEEAAFLLDCSETTAMTMVDDATLPAVNIALSTATRREVRIWRWAVLHRCIAPERKLQAISIAESLPLQREVWTMREVSGVLRCSVDHVYNFYDTPVAPGEKATLLTGPDRNAGRSTHGRRPRIFRDSLITLLTTRTIE